MAISISFRTPLFVLILLMGFSFGKTHAQTSTLERLFMELPEAAFKGVDYYGGKSWSKTYRDTLLQATNLSKAFEANLPYYLEKIDPRNGFLEFRSTGDGEGMNISMAYWNVGKEKLIGVVRTNWAMCCAVSDYEFYRYTGPGELTNVTAEVFPEITLQHFYPSVNFSKCPDREVNNPPMQIFLPQKGLDIQIIPDFGDMEYEFSEETLKAISEIGEGKELTLRFDAGKFVLE